MLKQISILVVIVLVVSGSAMAYFVDTFSVDSMSSYDISGTGGVNWSWNGGSEYLKADYPGSGGSNHGYAIRNNVTLTDDVTVSVDYTALYAANNFYGGLVLSDNTNPYATGAKSLKLAWVDDQNKWYVLTMDGTGSGATEGLLGWFGSSDWAAAGYNVVSMTRQAGAISISTNGNLGLTGIVPTANYQYAGAYAGHWEVAGMAKFDNLTYVPEPASMLILASGFLFFRRRKA